MAEMTPLEAAEMLKMLEEVSFCDAAYEARACRYSETGCLNCEWMIAKDKIQNVFYAIAAGEYKPVVYAKWEIDEGGHKCSRCSEYLTDDQFEYGEKEFCPSCGALMDESREGNSLNGKDDSYETN